MGGKKDPMKQYWWQDQVWEIPDSSSPLALEEHLDCQCVQRHKTCFHPQTDRCLNNKNMCLCITHTLSKRSRKQTHLHMHMNMHPLLSVKVCVHTVTVNINWGAAVELMLHIWKDKEGDTREIESEKEREYIRKDNSISLHVAADSVIYLHVSFSVSVKELCKSDNGAMHDHKLWVERIVQCMHRAGHFCDGCSRLSQSDVLY